MKGLIYFTVLIGTVLGKSSKPDNDGDFVKNISYFFKDLTLSLQSNNLIFAYGTADDKIFDITNVNKILNENNIATSHFFINNNNTKESFFNYIKQSMEQSLDVTCAVMCNTMSCENFLSAVKKRDLIRRSLLYVFYWGRLDLSDEFLDLIHEAMRIVVVSNPRPGVFRLYYNQASSTPMKSMRLVNWWSGRMYKWPALPSAQKVFDDFEGRLFKVPVLHSPPWYFVTLHNDSAIKVTGGRDHQLLNLLAQRLNFRYEYFDPPDHGQGSGLADNGSFKGVLGLIHRREADFFLGDVTVTSERQKGVEFSFFTLADSGAFLTHAPRRLSETLALIRPFRYEVWPAVLASVLVSGPALWLASAGAALWRPRRAPPPPKLSRCVWFGISIFLKQSGQAPSRSVRARALTLLLSLAATYVLGDVYSATLTSLLARPGRESPIDDLFELERAMMHREYELYVERRSSSIGVLENGTGVYRRLWNLMQRQPSYVVRSVEQGVRGMLEGSAAGAPPVALLAGRETLYFDARRFGASNFQLSEKLYTRYSSVAMQKGCPYIENFNRVLMHLFEAGIITKITMEEYERLGDSGSSDGPSGDTVGTVAAASSSSASSSANGQDSAGGGGGPGASSSTSSSQQSTTQRLKPISMRMLQGAFYVLMFGYALSGLVLMIEIASKRRTPPNKRIKLRWGRSRRTFAKMVGKFKRSRRRIQRWIRWRYYRLMAVSDLSLEFVH